MPVTYDTAAKEIVDLLEQVRDNYHGRLVEHNVKVGVLMAYAPVDDHGQPKGHALKGHAGAPAAAKIKAVALKDRLTKKYDVELILDGDLWKQLPDPQRIALLDHELTHVRLTGRVDDLRRPIVKMRDEDFIVWGFFDVIQRHGANALEARSVRNLMANHGQLLLEGIITEPEPGDGIAATERFVSKSQESRTAEEVAK